VTPVISRLLGGLFVLLRGGGQVKFFLFLGGGFFV